ncbi:OB-fold-containig protein [Methylobacterium brachiatum]
MTSFAASSVFPFTLAALVMVGLVLVEGVSLLIGQSLSGLVDGLLNHEVGFVHDGLETDADASNAFSPASWLSWLNVGRVPFLILLIVALAIFALAGFVLQAAAGALVGPLPAWIAGPIAVVLTAPVLRGSSRILARAIPRDETYVITADDLIGTTAEVTLGPLDAGLPGQVRALDRHGNAHFLRARAAPDAPAMARGERVLLVDRADSVFVAVPAGPEL